MDSAYVPVLAAFGGSAVGGLTSLVATWVTQRRKDSVRRLAQEKTRKQKLYKQFIDEASKLYADALVHDKSEVSALVDTRDQAAGETGFFLGAGQSAVIADVSEDWTSPIDTRMANLGGTVYRRAKSDMEDDVWFDDDYIPDSYLYPYEYIPSSYPLW